VNRNQHVSGFVFCSRWNFESVFIFPQVLGLDKIDPVFFTVGLVLRRIELKIHPGIENMP
jgi:hypothetical protein